MKQKLLVFFVLFSLIKSYGQTTRYIYETSVNPDSINLVTMKTERTFLDIKANRSLFISENKLIRDSLFATFKPEEKGSKKKENKDFSKSGKIKRPEATFFEYFITKDIPEQKVYYHDRVGGKQIYYPEDRPIKWEITNESGKQNGYPAQKAVANFGGRIWTAWFTKDISISDGPYKFSGLPGLIVKLEDDKGDYRFDLVKKIILQNSFEETTNPDAKLSTRINFQGDKAALELESMKGRKNMLGNGAGMQNFGGGRRHGGGMNGGGMGQHPGGMGGDMPMPNMNSESGSSPMMNTAPQNPIELR
ncbi:GLPGLI family protein [Chryseobacterium taiwanense]|uniref:GLPGLI family protein n=1 Tax=Chryseobacterium taiwanense TaxID=363331 RepID=UPI00068C66D7|nr:GLPGLI family protein [Chryseobacterium taiwanense]